MRKGPVKTAALIAGALVATLFAFAPVLWVLLGAFKTKRELVATPPVFLPDFTYIANFVEMFGEYWPFLENSLIVTIGATLISLIFALPTAFALVHLRVKASNFLADWILSTRMMPPIAAAVPLFIIYNTLGVLDNVWALTVAYAGFNLPFAVWVAMSFFRRVPGELIEAARVEGCSWFQVLIQVAIPVSLNGIATVTTFLVIFSWNEFLLALFLTGDSAKTFPVVIASFISTGRIQWPLIAASAVIQTIPPVLFAFFMQRQIITGMTMGAVKD